jgi:flagellar basal body-associated protein FliL
MKSKLKFIIPIVLVVLGGVYKFVLAKPAAVAKPKVAGTVYIMQKDFLLNLSDGKFAKLDVALEFAPGYTGAPAGGADPAAPAPPEGYGTLPEEPVVRAIVTDVITDATAHDLLTRKGRRALIAHIMHNIASKTDVKLSGLLFTDVTVQ